jgi:DNA-binding MarR family transcriptional regulator
MKDSFRWTPLAQRTYKEIRTAGPVTNKELVQRLGCARRSLFSVLGDLVSAGLITRRPDWTDLRRSLYEAR